MEYVLLMISAILVNNFVLSKFLGICPFLGVSKKISTALGMSGAVIFVITIASAVTWCLEKWVLVPLGLEKFLETLSFILVIAALVHNPPAWILDEPMTGLYPTAAYVLKQMMREHAAKGNAVFFSTHVLEVAEKLCDRILIIHHGKELYQGTVENLQQQYPGKDLESIFMEITGGLRPERVSVGANETGE